MNAARLVRRELDLWKLVWQQVEAFLERIDGAREQDEPHRRKAEALLRAAGVVERNRGSALGAAPLAEPVVDTLPSGRWTLAARSGRIPGSDELELAVGMLTIDENSGEAQQAVRLPARREIVDRRVDGALQIVWLPSYPAPVPDAGDQPFDITAEPDDDRDVSSLFPRGRRRRAATDTSGAEVPIAKWSELCARRRARAGNGGGPGGPPPSSPVSLAATALAVLDGLSTGAVQPSAAAGQLSTVASRARTAAGRGSAEVEVLNAAADVLDEEGAKREALPGELRATATYVGRREAVSELANAADALRANIFSTTARNRLRTAANALVVDPGRPPLLNQAVEAGPLRADLDDATGARVGYPDGTLRMVRTLEGAFVANWNSWVRWFSGRHATVLQPLIGRFRRPFTTSVRALVQGGTTGLACEGLSVGQDTTVGSDSVITGQPASLRSTLDDLRPGQVGVVLGDRPSALVVVGLGQVGPRLSLGVSPLRVSVSAEGEGSPGVLAAGEPILCDAPGLSSSELRRGESDGGPAGDGLVQEVIALWSRLCLVFGSHTVQAALGGAVVPQPSSAPLQGLVLFGKVPMLATFLVLAGVPEAYWDRTQEEPESRLARPGEMLLLRGWADPEGAEGGATVQAAVEVETVFRTTGSMLERMDLSSAARLSTSPLELDPTGEPDLVCGPEEDVTVVMLRRSWMRRTLTSNITLRRDFAGFEAPCLATERLLPRKFLKQVLGKEPVEVDGVDREHEFTAALETFKGWLRFADE